MVNAKSSFGTVLKNLLQQASKAYELTRSVRAMIRDGGEQGLPGRFSTRLSSEFVGLASFLGDLLMSSHVQSLSRRLRTYFRDRFRCRFCGRSVLTGELSILDLTLDHLSPKAIGGNNEEENLVTACRMCNSLKSSMVFPTIEEAAEFIRTQRDRRIQELINNAVYQAGFQPDRSDLFDLIFAVKRQMEVTA